MTVVIDYPSTPLNPPTPGPTIAELCDAADALIQPVVGGGQRFGPEIEGGVADLSFTVVNFRRKYTVGRVASHLLEEAFATARRVRDIGSRERGQALDGMRSASNGLASLAIVPPVSDVIEALVDQEVRANVRQLDAEERAELLEEMRTGGQLRAMLASARHPMPTDFDIEAAELYRRHSEPAKRQTLVALSETYETRKAAAEALIQAADATKAIVARFVQLEAARDAQIAHDNGRASVSIITSPAAAATTAPPNATPAQWTRPSVQVEGRVATITRVD